jgi:hypothetical protein
MKLFGIILAVVGLNVAIYCGLDSALSGKVEWLPQMLWGEFGIGLAGLALMYMGTKIAQRSQE